MVGWLVICVNNQRTFQALALKLLLVNHIKINIIFIIIFVQVEVDLLKYINNDDDDDDDDDEDDNNNNNNNNNNNKSKRNMFIKDVTFLNFLK